MPHAPFAAVVTTLLAVATLGAACGAPVETPTLTTLKRDVFEPRCGNAACHGGSNPAAGLDLVRDPHAALVGVTSSIDASKQLVVAGDPDDSLLLQLLQGPVGSTEQMPPGFQLDDADVQAVRAWIEAGAAND